MSDIPSDLPDPRTEEVLAYPVRQEAYDPAAESYRLREEAVFLGTEGRAPVHARGDVLEDGDGQLDVDELGTLSPDEDEPIGL